MHNLQENTSIRSAISIVVIIRKCNSESLCDDPKSHHHLSLIIIRSSQPGFLFNSNKMRKY